MYRVVILNFVFLTALANLNKEQCRTVFNNDALFCCKKQFPIFNITMPDDISECNNKDLVSVRCARDICVGKKLGFVNDDGEIDKVKYLDFMTKEMTTDASLVDDVKSKCINLKDIEMYAPAEFCESMKISHCVSMHWMKHCPEWNDAVDCPEFKELVDECMNLASENS